MKLSYEQLLTARYVTRDVIVRRRIGNQPTPPEVLALHRDIVAAIAACGSENNAATAPLDEDDLIGTAQAAKILDCSRRHVRDIAGDLDGIQVGRDWVFSRRVVVEYAQMKGVGNGRTPSRHGAVPTRAA